MHSDKWASSAGSIIKKITEINPRLGVQDISAIIRASLERVSSDRFTGNGEEINEAKAIAYARASLLEAERASSKNLL